MLALELYHSTLRNPDLQKMQIIFEEILPFREFPQEYLQMPLKKYDSRYRTLTDPQPFKNTSAS